ncbi:hypothetical protein IAU59_004720 [Kwoniella sp. CBS 9459]
MASDTPALASDSSRASRAESRSKSGSKERPAKSRDKSDESTSRKSKGNGDRSSRKKSSSRSGKENDRAKSKDSIRKRSSRSDSARKEPSSTSTARARSAAEGAKAPGPAGRNVEDDGTRGGVMAKKCSDFRFYMLFTSGGWMGDLIMTLSDITGVWELAWLAILFVASWTVLRISQVEITLILGHIYDLTIPLQYHFNPAKQRAHASHLDQYWPIFFVGTIVEFGSFILVHPDLFTLIACIKTLALLSLWLGRDKNGRFLTSRFGGRPSTSLPRGGKEKETSSSGDKGASKPETERETGRGKKDRDSGKKDRAKNDRSDGKDMGKRKERKADEKDRSKKKREKKSTSAKDSSNDKTDGKGDGGRSSDGGGDGGKRSDGGGDGGKTSDGGGDDGRTSDDGGSSNASTPASTSTPSASSLPSAATTPSSAGQTQSPVTAEGASGTDGGGGGEGGNATEAGQSTDGATDSEAAESALPAPAEAKGRKHPYDIKEFTGNLMPIRRKKPIGPKWAK